jgi:endonuclease I
MHRNDANTADIIWDMYSDNPTGPEPYTYTYGVNQCSGTSGPEGFCYNREHTTPQSWFAELPPMVSDAHHIFPTDAWVNGLRSNFPFGEVTTTTTTTLNGSKLGTGNNFGYTGTVFEPISAYKGDLARAGLYMSVRYEDEIISQNWSSLGTANLVFLSPAEQPDAAQRRLQIYDSWYLNTLIKWSTQDPVSQKEIDRNNVVYYQVVDRGGTSTPAAQANRNPFIDHPEYVAQIFQCTGVVPVTIIDFTARKIKETVLLNWYATHETNFKKYIVERSTNGLVFNTIGEVEGTNLANYTFTDHQLPNAAKVYYRLRMLDIDGKSRTGKIIPVRLNNNLSNAIVYPNPTRDNLNIKLNEGLKANSTVYITDVTGRVVLKTLATVNAINITLDIKDFAPGRYFVKIQNASEVINESFVIIK